MRDFQYADKGDKLTDALISENYDGAYWAESESRLLERARAYISRFFGHEAQKKLRMLDLGCGMGRLIPDFAALYGSVVGLEPDEERSTQARAFLADRGVRNAEVIRGSLEDYLAEQKELPAFDVVLCSHVFQHISHDTLFSMLRALERCTGEKTVFLFTTTYTWGEENEYTFETFREGARVSSVTDRAGFEAAVRDGTALPVCRFARPWLEGAFHRFGLAVREFSCYHFFGEHNAENDPMNTLDPEKRKLARDAFYLCARGASEAGLTGESLAGGKIAYLQYYYLRDEAGDLASLPPEQTPEDSGPAGRKVLEDIATSQGFLYGAGLHFPARRYVSEDLGLRREGLPIRESHAIFTVYPGVSVCQVSVCLSLEDTPVRNFVWLHQIQTSEAAFFRMGNEEVSIPGLCRKTLEKYGLRSAAASSTALITELNRLGDCRDAVTLEDAAARCLYGVMSGDEGWAHVPASMARRRMDCSWSSRDFVRVVAFANNFLVLNLNRQEVFQAYISRQHDFADRYWGGLNPYFTMDADTAGVNHGVYFSVETGMVMQTLADRFLHSRPDALQKGGVLLNREMKANKFYRAEMIRAMNQVERVAISELGELDDLVLRSLNIAQRLESIRNLLELLESDMDLIYQTNTNRMVTLLTVAGLLLAAAQVVLAIVLR